MPAKVMGPLRLPAVTVPHAPVTFHVVSVAGPTRESAGPVLPMKLWKSKRPFAVFPWMLVAELLARFTIVALPPLPE